MNRLSSPEELEAIRESIIRSRDPNKTCIVICGGTGCLALGAEDVIAGFRRELQDQGLETKVDLRITGCPGFCERGPLVLIKPESILYQQVRVEDVPEMISETIRGNIVDRLLYIAPNTGGKILYEHEVPFYRKQKRLIIGNNSNIDPTIIEHYLALGGYSALGKTLFNTSPEQIIEEIKTSGLQ